MNLLDLLFAAFRLWTPVALASLGGVVSERSGTIALGLEGMMLAGAFTSVSVTSRTGNLWAGSFAGVLAGALVGLLHALFTQYLRVSHILSGVALNLGILGLTTFLVRLSPEGVGTKQTNPPLILTVAALLLTVALYGVLYRTPLGLRLRACGENPKAALSAGVPVGYVRCGAVTMSGALAGLGGVALALAGLGAFTENMTAGRGYIALAAVIFGRWNPIYTALAALLFSFGDALQLAMQTAGLSQYIPPDFLGLLPYALTLIALMRQSGRTEAPAALGVTEDTV